MNRRWFAFTFLAYTFISCAHPYAYDVAIIGAGASGIVAAKTAAHYGLRVALIHDAEGPQARMHQSGIAIKSLIYAGEIAATIAKASEFGLALTSNTVSTGHLFAYIKSVADQVAQNFNIKHLADDLIHIFSGRAHFINRHTLDVNGTHITALKCIIATGGEPLVPSINGIEQVPYVTEDSFFRLEALPKSLIIFGEGPLGIELATALHRLGVKVTLLIPHGLILPKYDFELVEQLQKMLQSEGICIKYRMEITHLAYEDNIVTATCKNNFNKISVFKAEKILFALSRTGRIDNLGLEAIGVESSAHGILVNDTMQTSVANMYACGNAVGQMFTLSRVSYYQAQVAAQNVAKRFWQKDVTVDYSNTSSFIQAVCPLGAIGLTEQEARKIYGKKLKVYRFNYTSLARAHIEKTTKGVAKFLCDASGTLLGVHVLGAAADLIIDSVRIGQNFAEQFKDYLLELRTSPNYLDLVWSASKCSQADSPRTIFKSLLQYIKKIL